MKKLVTVLFSIMLVVFLSTSVWAGDVFTRDWIIPADTLDIGGFGHIIAGLDLDGDGYSEIYAINSDWHDVMGKDLIPRIYKYEREANGDWSKVWSTRLPLDFQNTWGALTYGDIDQDGKGEVIWGPCNNFGGGLQPNPERIVIFETPGDGTDNMGVQNPDGTWRPNAQWTITANPSENIRPFRWYVNDIDGDGHDEIVAGCRAGDGIEVYSVDTVPDAADSTETWSLEFSGVSETFYDIAIMNGVIYGIDNDGDVWAVKYDAVGDSFVVADPQNDIAGLGSWKSAQTVDIDNDGTDEIILASWNASNNDIYLLQQSGDTLVSTMIKNVPDASYRSYGGAVGDVDNNGLLDFVFGTRQSTPNGIIHRLAYQGGSITDSLNWKLTVIDSLIDTIVVQYDITAMADVDGDGLDEVLYSGTPRGALPTDPPPPIVILSVDLTGIDQGQTTVVEDFKLEQNYPNPFNPETQIRFTIPRALPVRLNVYNIRGQLVRTLVNSAMTAGSHTVRWDGLDNHGVKVASGVYVYSIKAGEFVQAKKMTMLK